ncbi:hypothetical protein D9619_001319 [Psilocybe cf. subviscida]|uniref:Uncharacterized protein n=1 Tax=Psilocybe cf. subviscida TaxID=2480587 RepID=A0A8H5BGB9_9AGAR|nr:hypothetical protein D9619_001319 [Psilocybe cf. subviscida]
MSVVSSVLSRVSTRSRSSTGWNVNVSFSSLMDSLFSIAFGLGLRFVVDTVSRQDFKLTGTLVGLWEGVILLHFTKKMPKSSDPYIAFAVRLGIDFFLTESVARLVLVLIWTGLGMILADITPAIWSDVGLNRVWRHFRRDLYTMAEMVPTVAFFPPQRTVRFSPSHAPTAIGNDDDAASDITATERTPSAPVPPPNPILPASRDARKRRVPGHYGFEYSDTETERSYAPRGSRTSRRLSVYPGQAPYDSASDSMSSITPTEDVDAGNLSDGASSTGGTERAGQSSTSIVNLSEVQGTEEEAPAAAVVAPIMAIDTAVAAAVAAKDDEAGNRTPTQQPLWIPPTPSDSAAAWRLNRKREAGGFDDAKPTRPLGEPMPQIPDFLDEPRTEDWTDIGKSVTADPFTVAVTAITAEAPPIAAAEDPAAVESNTLLDPPGYEAWPSGQPPAEREYKTAEDFDDIYGEEAPATAALAAVDGEAPTFAGETGDLLGEGVEGGAAPEADAAAAEVNAWDEAWADPAVEAAIEAEVEKLAGEIVELEQEAKDLEEKEAEIKRLADEAEAQRLAEEEAAAEAKRIADEAEKAAEAEAKRVADEAAAAAEAADKKDKRKKKKEKEAEERRLKEEADELARQEKRAEEERKEAEAKEQKRKDLEAAAERRALKKKEKEDKALAEAEAKRKAQEEQEERDRKDREEREEADRQAKEEQQERERKEKEEADEAARKEKEETERKEREEAEKIAQEALERQEEEAAALASAALDAALAQEQEDAEANAQAQEQEQEQAEDTTAPGQEAAAGDLPVSTGFSPEPLVNLDDPAEEPSAEEPTAEEPTAEEPTATAPAYEESIVSDATAGMPPQDPRERLERSMTLRAQMVEIQNQIDDLKAGGAGDDSPQLKQLEKIMRKMVRQATRRYAAGIECAQYLNGFDDTSDVVTLENVHPSAVMKKIAEQIESLLSPSARSLHFSIQVAKKAADAKKQKPKVISLIDEFNLTNYTEENSVNKKLSEIYIPEEEFGTWLTGYRNLLARRAQEAEEPAEYSPWG